MKWKGLFLAFLVSVFCFMYFSKREFSRKEDFSRELLEKISYEDKKSLSSICKGVFYSSTFGYTLFGDKPISVICDSGRPYENEEMSFFQKHLFILAQGYENKLDAPHFAIVVEDTTPNSFIYLVNKKAFYSPRSWIRKSRIFASQYTTHC